MTQENSKPYIDFKFLGVRSFIELMQEAGTAYTVIDDDSIENLYREENSFLKKDLDTVVLGSAQREKQELYFVQFGIMIAPDLGVRSFIVFIFNNRPDYSHLKITAGDIEYLVNEYLDSVQKSTVQQETLDNSKGTIN